MISDRVKPLASLSPQLRVLAGLSGAWEYSSHPGPRALWLRLLTFMSTSQESNDAFRRVGPLLYGILRDCNLTRFQ